MTDQIKSVRIYTIVDPATGEEGIAGVITPQGGRPLIAVDDATLEEIKPLAQDVANVTGLPVTLAEFDTRSNVETVEPQEDAAPSPRLTAVPAGDPDYEPKLEDFESEK